MQSVFWELVIMLIGGVAVAVFGYILNGMAKRIDKLTVAIKDLDTKASTGIDRVNSQREKGVGEVHERLNGLTGDIRERIHQLHTQLLEGYITKDDLVEKLSNYVTQVACSQCREQCPSRQAISHEKRSTR
jgi:hypothetical protein